MKPFTAVLSCSAVAAIAVAGWAQTPQQQERRPAERDQQRQQQRPMDQRPLQQRIGEPQAMLHHVADVHGKRVENLMGENLGSIDTLIADMNEGRVTYAIVSVGGFLGIGDTLVAVPWEAFQLRPMFDGLVLDVTRSELEAAPTFTRERWPNFTDQQWQQETHRYYGTTPGTRPGMRDRDWDRDRRPGMRDRDDRPGMQMPRVQEQLERAFTTAGIEQREAQMHARQLAQRIQRERPDQQQLVRMIEQEMTRAGVDEQQARREAQRTAEQLQPMLDRPQPGFPRPDRTQPDRTQPDRTTTAPGELFARTKDLIGTKVENRAGENLGNFDNIAMEIESGKIEFAVIGVGGFLGLWQSHVTAPWDALEITRVDDTDYRIVLNATREQLDRAPEYDMDKWPTQRDVEWAGDAFPGTEPRRDRPTRDPMRERSPQPRDR